MKYTTWLRLIRDIHDWLLRTHGKKKILNFLKFCFLRFRTKKVKLKRRVFFPFFLSHFPRNQPEDKGKKGIEMQVKEFKSKSINQRKSKCTKKTRTLKNSKFAQLAVNSHLFAALCSHFKNSISTLFPAKQKQQEKLDTLFCVWLMRNLKFSQKQTEDIEKDPNPRELTGKKVNVLKQIIKTL